MLAPLGVKSFIREKKKKTKIDKQKGVCRIEIF